MIAPKRLSCANTKANVTLNLSHHVSNIELLVERKKDRQNGRQKVQWTDVGQIDK